MPDVRFLIEVDATGAVKSVKNFDDVLDDLKKKSEGADTAHKSLWKQVALGQLAYDGAKKAAQAFVDLLGSSIKSAIDSEDANSKLNAALETTGRTVAPLSEHFKKYADELMGVTVYDDEAIKGSQALLLTMVSLDKDGIDKATRGAVGLASVYKIDLQTATKAVGMAYAGNYSALGRMIPGIKDAKTESEKLAIMNAFLEKSFQRAQAETGTFGGKLKQLSNSWGEVKESIGGAIVKNESIVKLMGSLKDKADAISKSPDFSLWLSAVADEISTLVKWTGKLVGGIISIENALLGGKGYREYVAQAQAANGVMQAGINVLQFRAAAIRGDVVSASEWAAAWKKYGNDYSAMMKAIASGKEGPELKKLYDDLKKKTDENTEAQKKLAPAINETGTKTGTLTEEELKAIAAKKDLAEAIQGMIDRNNPLVTSIRKVREDEEKVNKAFKSGAIDAKQHKAAIEALADEYTRLVGPVKSADDALLKLAMDAKGNVIPGLQATAAEAGKAAAITKESWIDAAKKWVKANEEALDKMFSTARTITAGIDAIAQQSTNNKMLLLDKEYQAKLDNIKNSLMSEEEKNTAITALDAEYEMKRRAVQRKAAESAKTTAIANAIISTLEGVAKALGQGGIFGIVLGAIVAAFGAIQIAKIKAQPIPLAQGAIFRKPVFSPGNDYVAGDAGPEAVIPLRELPRMLREISGGRGGGGTAAQKVSLTVPIYIGAKKIQEEIFEIVVNGSQTGGLRRMSSRSFSGA